MRGISILVLLGLSVISAERSPGECSDICNSFIREVLTLEMCRCVNLFFCVLFTDREAKKLLPRPKIGDFCTRAMEDGFKDACYAMCNDRDPIPRISQACRAAAMELPRPTVRKWCEHGYRQGFKATIDSLSDYFTRPSEPEVVATPVPVVEVHDEVPAATQTEPPVVHTPTEPVKPAVESLDLPILKSIPITLDEKVYDLNIYDGQSPEDSVALFCQQHMPDDLSGCIRQLLPIALEE